MQNQKELEKLLNTDSEESQPKPLHTSIWARYPDPPKSEERFQEDMQVKTRKKRQPKKQKISELGDTVAPDKGISFADNGALELLASASLTVPRAETKEGEMHPADEMALAEWKKHSSYDRWVVEADCTKTNPEYCTTLFDHYEELRRNVYEKARNACKDATPAAPCASS